MARPGYHDPAYDPIMVTGEATSLDDPGLEERARRLVAHLKNGGSLQDLFKPGDLGVDPAKMQKIVGIARKILNFGSDLKSTYPSAGFNDESGLMAGPEKARGTGLGDIVFGDAPESWEKQAAGDSAFTQYGRIPLPVAKPGRAGDVLNMVGTLPLGSGMEAISHAPGLIGAVRKAGDKVPKGAAREWAEWLIQAEKKKADLAAAQRDRTATELSRSFVGPASTPVTDPLVAAKGQNWDDLTERLAAYLTSPEAGTTADPLSKIPPLEGRYNRYAPYTEQQKYLPEVMPSHKAKVTEKAQNISVERGLPIAGSDDMAAAIDSIFAEGMVGGTEAVENYKNLAPGVKAWESLTPEQRAGLDPIAQAVGYNSDAFDVGKVESKIYGPEKQLLAATGLQTRDDLAKFLTDLEKEPDAKLVVGPSRKMKANRYTSDNTYGDTPNDNMVRAWGLDPSYISGDYQRNAPYVFTNMFDNEFFKKFVEDQPSGSLKGKPFAKVMQEYQKAMQGNMVEWEKTAVGKPISEAFTSPMVPAVDPKNGKPIIDPATGKQGEMSKYAGWHWRDLTSEGDLRYEGNKMGHCVGGPGYCEKVKRGEIKIFSLRNAENKPQLTIEVSREPGRADPMRVVQIKLPGNKRMNSAPLELNQEVSAFLNNQGIRAYNPDRSGAYEDWNAHINALRGTATQDTRTLSNKDVNQILDFRDESSWKQGNYQGTPFLYNQDTGVAYIRGKPIGGREELGSTTYGTTPDGQVFPNMAEVHPIGDQQFSGPVRSELTKLIKGNRTPGEAIAPLIKQHEAEMESIKALGKDLQDGPPTVPGWPGEPNVTIDLEDIGGYTRGARRSYYNDQQEYVHAPYVKVYSGSPLQKDPQAGDDVSMAIRDGKIWIVYPSGSDYAPLTLDGRATMPPEAFKDGLWWMKEVKIPEDMPYATKPVLEDFIKKWMKAKAEAAARR